MPINDKDQIDFRVSIVKEFNMQMVTSKR